MTVTTQLRRTTLNWTGAETSFPAGFPADQAADVSVIFRSAAGVETTLAQGVQYSVTLASTTKLVTVTPISLPAAPGTVTILRTTPALMQVVLLDGQEFPASVHQGLHDRGAMRDGENRDDASRSLALTPGSVSGSGQYDAKSNRISSVAAPQADSDAATRGSVLAQIVANYLSIDGVTTGAPGSPAAATISGTPPKLALTIPRGDVGAQGSVWRTGAGVPSNALGVDGDLYLRTATADVYQRAGGSYAVVANITGLTGPTGSVWRTGAGVPSNALGVDGDVYLRTTTGDVYQRAGGSYSVVANITGPVSTVPGPGYAATSTTSLAIGTGSKAFTTQAGLAYTGGARARATSSSTSKYMEGVVASYAGTTLTLTVDNTSGTGTLADWTINIAGDKGASGTGSGTVSHTGTPASGDIASFSDGTGDNIGSFQMPTVTVLANATGAAAKPIGVTLGAGLGFSSGVLLVPANSLVNSRLNQMAQNTVKGRASSGTGDPEDIALGAGLAFSGGQLLVPAGGIANSQLGTIATATIKGRATTGTGAPEDLTPGQVAAFGGSGAIVGVTNATFNASVAANALTIDLKNAAGNNPSATDPVALITRSTTAGNGTYTALLIAAALSLTVPSGATLGIANGAASRLWIVLFNDGGTPRLGVMNSWSGSRIYPLDETSLASSTAISGAATAAGTIYTGAAVTSKAFRILGYVEYTTGLTTAGTYASAPQIAQLFGPGVKKPNDVVQTVSTSTKTFASTTSTSYVDMITAAITPSSPANIARVVLGGDASIASGSNITIGTARSGQTTPFGTEVQLLSSGVATSPASGFGLDLFNTSSAVTYAGRAKVGGGGTCYYPNNSGSIEVQELMR